MAVIPSDGRIVSPVDAQVVSVADTAHAYGLKTEDGIELLIHAGLETVSLKGECFKVHVKQGDTVKAGDVLAEMDLKFLEERKLNPITPVLICGGMEGKILVKSQPGQVEAGKSELLTVAAKPEEAKAQESERTESERTEAERTEENQKAVSEPEQEKKKLSINFDFLQKLVKVLMAVIAVMPAAGLMISIGKLVQMAGADMSMIFTVGSTMESIGWAIINNLHILFAVAIGGSWAKERAGGAFAAVIAFILINVITGALFGITSDMLADPEAVTHTLFGKEILVNGYFTSVLGAPALNMGVFVGIISGFVGGIIYNKYYNYFPTYF